MDFTNMKDSHTGTAKYLVGENLGLMISGRIFMLPFGSSNVCNLINYCMWYIVTTIFQFQINNSF